MSDADAFDEAATDLWIQPEPPTPEPPPAEKAPALLRVEELAALLRINRKSAYAAVEDGTIPGVVRIGRVIRVSRDAVLQWTRGQGGVSRSRRKR
jgi:excisionase family DNA binding protein